MIKQVIDKGFTLLEILLVVLILSIMTAVGANIINSQSIERIIVNQAQKFNADLQFICEKSVLENQAFGFEVLSTGYQVLRHQQQDWLLLESQVPAEFNDSIHVELLFEGRILDLSHQPSLIDEHLPHIICQSDGSFNAFEIRFSAATVTVESPDEDSTYYALKSETPWQLIGAWHQP